MPMLNTLASYSFRCLSILSVVSFGLLSKMRPGNPSSDAKHFLALDVVIGLTCVSLVLDWATRKDPSRKLSKLIDTVLGIAWVLLIGAMIIYSLSMGTL
jgi:hypothetical protein